MPAWLLEQKSRVPFCPMPGKERGEARLKLQPLIFSVTSTATLGPELEAALLVPAQACFAVVLLAGVAICFLQ